MVIARSKHYMQHKYTEVSLCYPELSFSFQLKEISHTEMLKFYVSLVGIIVMDQIVSIKMLELLPVLTGKSAIDLVNSLDLTSDPCQDFFQFACGNWLNQHQPIPKSKPEWTEYDILDAKLNIIITGILQEPNLATDAHSVKSSRDMFAACIDMETRNSIGLEPLTDFLNHFGGWPMTLDSWNESHFDWKEATATVTKFYSSAYLINVYNDVDQMNTNRSVIYVDQGSLILPRSTLVDGDEPKVKDAYIAYAINSAKAIRDYLDSDVRDSFIEKEVKNMLEFERQLAELMTPDEDRRNLTTMYNPMLLSELQILTSSSSPQAKINWLALMNDIYSLVNITISSNERVIIVDPSFIKKFVSLLENTAPRVLANYFHWRLVYDLAPDTTQQMIDLQFAFLKVQLGTSEPGIRSNVCASQINYLIGYAVGSKYVEKMFDDDSKTEIELMVANLKRAFKSLVDEAGWMDAATKEIAKDKADAMLAFIGYPSWIKNHTALDAYYDEYDGIEISRTMHFFNVQNCNLYSNRLELASLREDTDRTEWNSVPAIANAFYASESNSITFPAGILQSPFFSKGRMAAMNYGAIGSVIGHEITHGFDDQGRQSDKYGNTVQWWTKDTLAQYLTRSKCFIDEYANFTIPNSKLHINGVNTQGENIADNGGIRESFRAYTYYTTKYGPETTPSELKQFSPEQIFFLSFAHIWCGVQTPESLEHDILTDVHSPSRYRIIGTLSNSEDFNRAFNCSTNATMNRVDKCVLW